MGYVFDGINQMNSLLTDLLSYAKLDSRNKAWKLTKVNLPKLVGEVKRSLINVIEEKNAKIVVEHLPKEIIANQTTLMQLFQNLISNALKFAGDNAPIVRINCVVKDEEYIFSFRAICKHLGMDPDKTCHAIMNATHRISTRRRAA